MTKTKPIVRYRSAETGQYVTGPYAEKHKATTVKETTPPPKPKKR